MKYCKMCGLRTNDDSIAKCVCCNAQMFDGQGDASREAWAAAGGRKNFSSSSKVPFQKIMPQVVLIVIAVVVAGMLRMKSEDIKTFVDEKKEARISSAVEEAIASAYGKVEEENWDEALSILESAKEDYEGRAELEEAYDHISYIRPTALQDVSFIDYGNVTFNESAESDDHGNEYAEFVRFDASLNAVREYNLVGKYRYFYGTIFVPSVADSGKDMWVQIFCDGELAYEKFNISESTGPLMFQVDIEGVTSMSIVTGNNGSYSYGYMDFANTYLGNDESMLPKDDYAVRESGFILPESNSRYISEEELEGFTAVDCRIARNEIYARHGRIYEDEELKAYFESYDWYEPTVSGDDFQESWLNEFELANLDVIIAYEEAHGYR